MRNEENSNKKIFYGMLYEYGMPPHEVSVIKYSKYSLEEIKENSKVFKRLFGDIYSKWILDILMRIPDFTKESIFNLCDCGLLYKDAKKLFNNKITIQKLREMDIEQLQNEYKFSKAASERVFIALDWYNTDIERNKDTNVYARLYEDGSLLLSSYDYIDKEKKLIKEYKCGDISSEDKNFINNIIILDRIIVSNDDYFMKHCFSGLKNIKKLDLRNLDYSNVTDLVGMFFRCERLEELNLLGFNTSNVVNMSSMFYGCRNLEILDLSSFDTTNVKSMFNLFCGCEKLEVLNISNFNTINVRSMFNMFRRCKNLKELDLSMFDTSNVEEMFSMFRECNKIEKLNLSSFNTSKVINMRCMFEDCENLKELDLSNFDLSNTNDISHMFYNCKNLEILNIPNFNTSNFINKTAMFSGCKKLKIN